MVLNARAISAPVVRLPALAPHGPNPPFPLVNSVAPRIGQGEGKGGRL